MRIVHGRAQPLGAGTTEWREAVADTEYEEGA